MVGQISPKYGPKKKLILLALAITLPVLATLAGSYFLGNAAIEAQENQNQQMKTEEVRAQSRLLLETVWDEIDSVKIRALAYSRLTASGDKNAELDREIRTYSLVQLDGSGQFQKLREFTKNASWSTQIPQDLQARIETAARQISLKQVRDTGASIVRIQKSPVETTEQLGIAFFNPSSPALIFVTVDPTEAFGGFARWTTRREAGNLRGYLIGADGKVLVHSERAYSGSDFSGTELFQQALRPTFHDERISGIGTYRGADLRNVLTSYLRVASLPFAVVVERVTRVNAGTVARQLVIPEILLVMASLIVCLFSMIAVHKVITPEATAWAPALEPAMDQLAQAQQFRNFKHQLREALQDSVGELGNSHTAGQESVLAEAPAPETGPEKEI